MCVWCESVSARVCAGEARPRFIVSKSICGRKKGGREWWEEGSQRIPPFHSTVPVGTSWAGTNWCKINFPGGYNDPERSHTSLDQ